MTAELTARDNESGVEGHRMCDANTDRHTKTKLLDFVFKLHFCGNPNIPPQFCSEMQQPYPERVYCPYPGVTSQLPFREETHISTMHRIGSDIMRQRPPIAGHLRPIGTRQVKLRRELLCPS